MPEGANAITDSNDKLPRHILPIPDPKHVGLTTYDDQRGGLFQIKDNTGKMLVELGIDNAGVGYIDAVERK